MKENILYNFLEDKPSLLHYEDELKLIDIMTKLPMNWLINNKQEFIDALNQLFDSHTDGGFLYEEECDDIIFENFCKWLREVNKKIGIPTLELIDNFDPKELELDEFRKNIRNDKKYRKN